jgi:hypothetical protein
VEPPFEWDRSRVIGIASYSCHFCHGYGLVPVHRAGEVPCHCVFRTIFRICFRRFTECQILQGHTNPIMLERCGGPSGYRAYSRKREEFSADFILVSRRALDGAQFRLFDLHFLRARDWRLCCGLLGIDRGTFFHSVYAVERCLGRTFAELKPYPLYPIAEYFSGGEIEPQPAIRSLRIDPPPDRPDACPTVFKFRRDAA